MKKTLMVLSFALCAAFAFAQTQNVSAVKMQQNASAKAVQSSEMSGYKGSIFTKDDEPMKSWTFSANNQGYQIHNIGNGEVVGGRVLNPHTQTATHAQWQRFSGIDADAMAEWGNNYPVSISSNDADFRNNYGFGYFEYYMDPEVTSSATGFMVMSMQDQIQGWGGTGASGNFHSAICLEGFSTTDVPVFSLRMFQFFRKFNRDSCFIDYSTDSSTWNALEINVRNVDVEVNGQLWGFYEYTLPATATGNQANVYLRLRWDSHELAGGAYGYIWCLDDVEIYAGEESSWRTYADSYNTGGYHFMPQGLELPISWNTNLYNNGVIDQTNVVANLYSITNGVATAFATENIGTIEDGVTEAVQIDDAGWIDAEGTAAWPNGVVANPRFIPTTTVGEHFVTATITSDSLQAVYDTLVYNVTAEEDGDHVWAYDNGVLTRRIEQLFRNSISDNTIGDDGEFYTAGYQVSLRYKVGPNVPTDWVIRGMELVPSVYSDPDEGIYPSRPNTMISPTLTRDSLTSDGYIYFLNVDHGADVHTVTADEVNDTNNIGSATGEFETFGNYNTVRIDFPNQPELTPNTEFRVGYVLEQNGNFGVATVTNGYTYQLEGETESMAFSRDTLNGMKKYARAFGHLYSDVRFNDPVSGEGTWGNFSETPMIRLIVGPRVERPTYTIDVTCDSEQGAEGAVENYSGVQLCGATDNVSEGARATYYITYNEGDAVQHLYIDGTEVQPYDEENGTGDENYNLYSMEDETGGVSYYYGYTFRNVSANHTMRVVFGPEGGSTGINDVESRVAMKLVPNPASSQVKLSIAGVSGMVDLCIVDMSGRVVMNKSVDAESMQTIDLSNFAKGAYFVRVTNNEFSKVEKLIVR